jgi:transcriptional regulator
MYDLPYYKEANQAVVYEFMRTHPFVLLTGVDAANRPVATQVPVFIDEKDGKLFLTGHIMRQTDHHRAFAENAQALAVFTGAHTYVSASLYTNPQVGSTWNYMSVHARGTIRYLDETALIAILRRLTTHFENNPDSPASFENLPDEYISKMVKAIVAFELEVESLDHVFKLSQNRDAQSFDNIRRHLQQQGGDAAIIAAEMEKRTAQLFPV